MSIETTTVATISGAAAEMKSTAGAVRPYLKGTCLQWVENADAEKTDAPLAWEDVQTRYANMRELIAACRAHVTAADTFEELVLAAVEEAHAAEEAAEDEQSEKKETAGEPL